MHDSNRVQGGLICAGSALLGVIFLFGLLGGRWWAVAIPVALGLAFVLGLSFWVGWTIATVEVEPEPAPDEAAAPAAPAAAPGEGED